MSDPGQERSVHTGWGRGRSILFYTSLGLNLLVIGLVLGAILFGGRPGPRAVLDGPFPMVRALSEAERTAFVETVRAEAGEKGRARPVDSLKRSRELLRVLRAPEFDATRFDAIMAEQIRASSDRVDNTRTALTQVLSSMSRADRQAYADRVEMTLRKSFRDRRAPPPRP